MLHSRQRSSVGWDLIATERPQRVPLGARCQVLDPDGTELSSPDLRACLEVVEIAQGIVNIDDLLAYLGHALAELIPCDSAVVLVFDQKARHVLVGAYTPSEARFLDFPHRYIELLDQHPLFVDFVRTGDTSARTLSDLGSASCPRDFEAYRSHDEQFDTAYRLTMGLPVTPTLAAWIELGQSRRDFATRDRMVLDVLRPHCAHALRNLIARNEVRERRRLVRRATTALDIGMAALTPALGVRRVSRRAADLLATRFPEWSADSGLLPEALRAWVVGQTEPSSANASSPEPLRIDGEESCLVLHLMPGASQSVLIVREIDRPAPLAPLAELGLSPREIGVLTLVSDGKSNAEIGRALQVSPRTVDKHLEHIYEKLNVRTRTAAVVRALTCVKDSLEGAHARLVSFVLVDHALERFTMLPMA